MTAIEDRHARFLTGIRPRLDNLAPVMVSEHGRGFWTVLDPPRHGADSRVVFLTEGPGLAALESRELIDLIAELLDRYDPAYRSPPDLPGPFDPTRDHLVLIFEGGRAYLYRLDGTPNQTRPPVGFLLIVAGCCAAAAVIAARRQLREHPAQLEQNLGTASTPPPTE